MREMRTAFEREPELDKWLAGNSDHRDVPDSDNRQRGRKLATRHIDPPIATVLLLERLERGERGERLRMMVAEPLQLVAVTAALILQRSLGLSGTLARLLLRNVEILELKLQRVSPSRDTNVSERIRSANRVE